MDLIMRQARLMNGRLVDIGINDGKITAVGAQIAQNGQKELPVEGKLTLPAFVNGQLHACKSFWRRLLHTLPQSYHSLPRLEASAHVKKLYTSANVFVRVDEVMQLAIQNGTCAIRLFADVDEHAGLAAIDGLVAIRQKYSPLMTVQVVAFPQDGILKQASQSLMRQALERGADVVGGIPWIEPTLKTQQAHIEICFELAQAFDCDLHFVCDDVADEESRTLERVARLAIARGWHGRVCATQCAALSFYDDNYASEVIHLAQQAGMTIFCNSHVSLMAAEFDENRHPWPRGTTRIRALLAAGVPVAAAQDDIDNWFYPFGRNDMLEVVQFMAHNGRFGWHDTADDLLPMVTTTPATVMKLENYGLNVGDEANVVVLDATSWHDAIQFQPPKRFVILKGQIVAESWHEQRFYY